MFFSMCFQWPSRNTCTSLKQVKASTSHGLSAWRGGLGNTEFMSELCSCWMSCLRSKPRRGGKPCSWRLPQHSQHSPAAAGSTGRALRPFCACEPTQRPAGHGSPKYRWADGRPVPSPPSFPASLPPPAGSHQAVSSGTPLVLLGTRSSRHKCLAPPADGAGSQLAFFTQRPGPTGRGRWHPAAPAALGAPSPPAAPQVPPPATAGRLQLLLLATGTGAGRSHGAVCS